MNLPGADGEGTLLRASATAVDRGPGVLARATEAVRRGEPATARSTAQRLEREQHAVHGLAWLATYVEALRQLQGWARAARGERAASASSSAACSRSAFGEYLARILGGIPMSQGETSGSPALGLDRAAIASFVAAARSAS